MNWPLSQLNFTLLDKLAIARFILFNDRWTQGDKVLQFEDSICKFTNYKYSLFTSSGSTANYILAAYSRAKYNLKTIVVPATTWTTSISPWIQNNITPIFVDISFKDLSIDLPKLESILKNRRIDAVFVTSLLGFMPNMEKLKDICSRHNTHLFADHCESLLSLASQTTYSTATTSTYQGHQISSVEGGFILTNDEELYNFGLRYRNHGLNRSLPYKIQSKYSNPDVDPLFDFSILGNNFRNTDINALVGLKDLKRAAKYTKLRISSYQYAKLKLSDNYIFPELKIGDVPFSLPIILRKSDPAKLTEIKNKLKLNNIEYRPIISGNLLRQTPYKQFGHPETYKVSEHLHNNGIYVGLHSNITTKHIDKLVSLI